MLYCNTRGESGGNERGISDIRESWLPVSGPVSNLYFHLSSQLQLLLYTGSPEVKTLWENIERFQLLALTERFFWVEGLAGSGRS